MRNRRHNESVPDVRTSTPTNSIPLSPNFGLPHKRRSLLRSSSPAAFSTSSTMPFHSDLSTAMSYIYYIGLLRRTSRTSVGLLTALEMPFR